MRPPVLFLFTLLVAAPAARAGVVPPRTDPAVDLQALDRSDAAAEAALAAGDLEAALKYFDYFGHELEDFCRATLEYRLARQKLGDAVRQSLGRRAWGRAARALGVPRHGRGRGEAARSLRREDNVVYLKNAGADNEVPYVNIAGVWKVSAREVLVVALRVRFGESVEFEEADLYVLAGKTARVLRGRAAQLSSLAEDVRAKRVTSSEQLREAIDRIRNGAPAQ